MASFLMVIDIRCDDHAVNDSRLINTIIFTMDHVATGHLCREYTINDDCKGTGAKFFITIEEEKVFPIIAFSSLNASDLESEVGDKSTLIGGFPWEMRHNISQ